MSKIKKQSLVDQLYSQLREEIITLRYPLGSRLNVNEIQDDYGVSSTPLREALNRLQQEGLVVAENNVGVSVLRLDAHDVDEIEELALTLQGAAVKLSLQRGDRAQMQQHVDEQLARYAAARSPRERVRAVFELIGTFYRYCGNKRLDSSMVAVQGQVLLLRQIYSLCPGSDQDQDLLTRVSEGLRAGDEGAIVAALTAYSERSRRAIKRWLESQEHGQ